MLLITDRRFDLADPTTEVQCLASFGEVAVLMNTPAPRRAVARGPYRPLAVHRPGGNLGVRHQRRADLHPGRLSDQVTPCAIISTGSKQVIRLRPADTAYNGHQGRREVRHRALRHQLRIFAGCPVSAHLWCRASPIPVYTRRPRLYFTPPFRPFLAAHFIAPFLVERMAKGDFYIICRDNDVPVW